MPNSKQLAGVLKTGKKLYEKATKAAKDRPLETNAVFGAGGVAAGQALSKSGQKKGDKSS